MTQFQVTVPMDGSAEIRVAAPGYKLRAVVPRRGGSDMVISGAVQLMPPVPAEPRGPGEE